MNQQLARVCCLLLCMMSNNALSAILEPPFCGEEGVWIQVLRAGALRYADTSTSSSYLVWKDGKAKLLVDAGHGAALRFDESDADIKDIDAIAITHLDRENTSDLWAFLRASDQEKRLTLMGPFGEDPDFLTSLAGVSFARQRPAVRTVNAVGRKRWAEFGNAEFHAAAVPVDHGDERGLAWRISFGEQSITFTGDFSNQKDLMTGFARGSDALVANLGVPEEARGASRDAFARPSEIGRIAASADVRMLILGARGARTRGRESQTLNAIEAHYQGPVMIADDLECWGL
ncbi:MAG: MBL fold metallo-hydrolase [Gammaproteobacteria bacterium]|nr:MBL fold metallo-hydrolase [Gammaproteobacteria bacterium]MCY4322317.1 MBL fold metallo-hydrolase [Gammaproteobacteria bacterium]